MCDRLDGSTNFVDSKVVVILISVTSMPVKVINITYDPSHYWPMVRILLECNARVPDSS